MINRGIFFLICFCLLALAPSPLLAQSKGAEPPAPGVMVAPVVRKAVTNSFEFVGRVEAIHQVDLRARVEGFLEEVFFEEGTFVERGELLFRIEQAPYIARVEKAKADVASAIAAYENSESQFKRYSQLIKKKHISQAKMDEAEALLKQARASVLQTKALLRQAELDLDYTEIKAPVRGKIGRRSFSPGNLVNPNSGPLATIAGLDPIYVKVAIPEKQLLKPRRENFNSDKPIKPSLRLSDGEMYGQLGAIEFLDNQVDPSTDTIALRAKFPNPFGVLLPNQYVTLIVEENKPDEALVIPQVSVQENQQGRFVLVVGTNNKVQVRKVILGKRDGVDWVVEDGLSEGEMVITQGLQKVRPGITVNPTNTAASGS